MSKLKLRLAISNLDELYRSGVIANIYDISDRPGRKKSLRDLVIPAGPSHEPHRRFEVIDLAPGQYVVEAILPSGEAISEEISIKESAEPHELELHADESPHEWLRWHQFSGTMVQKTETYETHRRSIQDKKATVHPNSYLVSAVTLPPTNKRITNIVDSNAMVSRGFFFAIESMKKVKPIKHLSDFLPPARPGYEYDVTGPLQPYNYDDIYEVHSFDSDSVRRARGVNGYIVPGDYRQNIFERYYLFALGDGIPAQYCVLPISWMEVDHNGETLVEALLRHTVVDPNISPGVDSGYRLSVVVRSRLIGSVIGYLGKGNLQAAATILKEARHMLFEKVFNPLAAAAGVYVLLSTEQSDEPDYWHQWVHNLMKWFPWLPDGAIQHAWVMLHSHTNDHVLEEARANLLEGYRRGLPFYSKGVSLLLEGLTLFANDARAEDKKDQEVEEALKTARQLALRTDMRQPFTTVLL